MKGKDEKSVRYSHQKQTLGEEELMTTVRLGRVAGEILLSPEGRTAEGAGICRAKILPCDFEIRKVPFRHTIA